MAGWKPDYDAISPHHRYLSDEAVLVQAWKKSSAYMRRHNWYADHLELDLTTVRIQEYIRMWGQELRSGRIAEYEPTPMHLVPAPKAAVWAVGTKWSPTQGAKSLRLRPLAHLGIREQTAATAVMICLADRIETLQGNPGLSTMEARDTGVVSYGNRLFCQWQDGQAKFGWGNMITYRGFFTDYRSFLKRPTDVVAALDAKIRSTKNLAVVQLDLTGFYDRIRRDELIARLKRYALGWRPEERKSKQFWQAVERIFSWTWDADDRNTVRKYAANCLDDGLPQGLVAAGFLANAYMIDFDSHMRAMLKQKLSGVDWGILDYCRYVDDIRLVVSCDKSFDAEKLKDDVSKWVNAQLAATTPNQEVNPAKTEVTVVDDASTGIKVAGIMESIQKQISGPMDVGGAEQVLQALQGLFPLAEQAANAATVSEEASDIALEDAELTSNVQDLFTADIDVRHDTVERFAANRWRTAFRHLRRMTEGAYGESAVSLQLIALDDRAWIFAKRLVRRWAQDPSNVMLLRVAMDVYPSPHLLSTALGLLRTHLSAVRTTPTQRVCLFVAADLFRAGAIETGYVQEKAMLPLHADVAGYHNLLSAFAQELLAHAGKLPWYVAQQALLYLATQRIAVSEEEASAFRTSPLLTRYAELRLALDPRWTPSPDEPQQAAATAIIAHQIGAKTNDLATSLARMLGKCPPAEAARTADLITLSDELLCRRLDRVTKRGRLHRAWRTQAMISVAPKNETSGELLRDLGSRELRLMDVASRQDNPFQQESAALLFFLKLILVAQKATFLYSTVDPGEIMVACRNWEQLKDPARTEEDGFLTVSLTGNRQESATGDPRYELPEYCPREGVWRVVLGRILRAAITGRTDYTLPVAIEPAVSPVYRGIRSHWYKRQFGLFSGPDGLAGPGAPMSPWLGELLMALLWWPGMRRCPRTITDWDRISSPSKLTRLIRSRLRVLARLYGRASDCPIYEMPVTLSLKNPPHMTVVTVQTVLPRESDYKDRPDDLPLNRSSFRVKHRRHLAAVTALVEQTLTARTTFDKCGQSDLIVFPELSVHPKDIYLLERLMDRTKAMIFAGLVFQEREAGGPLVNRGIWLVPDHGPMGRVILRRWQGKQYMTKLERDFGICSHRSHQLILRVSHNGGQPVWRLTGAICYDATDLRLAADLRGKTDAFIVPAMNKHIRVFDSMAAALHYHMYQHFVIVNTGEYGGSTAQAPYRESYKQTIVHSHGEEQISVSIFEMNLQHFHKPACEEDESPVVHPPAGF